GQCRRDEAGHPLREVPASGIPRQTRSEPTSRNAPDGPVKRPTAGGLFRLVVAAGLLGYTLWRSDPSEVWRVAAGATMPPLLAAIGLVLLDRALMAWRWFVLLRP